VAPADILSFGSLFEIGVPPNHPNFNGIFHDKPPFFMVKPAFCMVKPPFSMTKHPFGGTPMEAPFRSPQMETAMAREMDSTTTPGSSATTEARKVRVSTFRKDG